MQFARLIRHAFATRWRTNRLFPPASLDAIEQAVAAAERSHQGQIRVAIETALTPPQILSGLAAHDRALEVFANLRVWDTERNNGVLIYVQIADRHVEIVADRGFRDCVPAAEWAAICRLMEQQFRDGDFGAGVIAGVAAIKALLAAHFPGAVDGPDAGNELPDRPALL